MQMYNHLNGNPVLVAQYNCLLGKLQNNFAIFPTLLLALTLLQNQHIILKDEFIRRLQQRVDLKSHAAIPSSSLVRVYAKTQGTYFTQICQAHTSIAVINSDVFCCYSLHAVYQNRLVTKHF